MTKTKNSATEPNVVGEEPALWVSPLDLRSWQRAKAGEIWAWSENVEGQCVPLYLQPVEHGEPVCWLYTTRAGTVEFAEQFDEDVYSFPVYRHPPARYEVGVREALLELADQADSVGQHLVYNAPTLSFSSAIKQARSALARGPSQVNVIRSWQCEHDALGLLIELLDAEPSIGDAEMASALERARTAWDMSFSPALSTTEPDSPSDRSAPSIGSTPRIDRTSDGARE